MARELDVQLHPAQLEIFNSTARFKVVSAGRRFGKSRLAAWILIIKALQSESKDVFYIGLLSNKLKILCGICSKSS